MVLNQNSQPTEPTNNLDVPSSKPKIPSEESRVIQQIEPIQSKKSGKKALLVLVIVGIVAVICGGVYIFFSKKDKPRDTSESTNNTSTKSTDKKTSEQVLAAITAGVAKLNPTDTKVSADNAVDNFMETLSDNSRVTVPADMYAEFGRQDGTLVIDKIIKVLNDNGLSVDKSAGDIYTSELVKCYAFANTFYARVTCVSVEKVKKYTEELKKVTATTEAALNLKLIAPFSVIFLTPTDGGTLVVARFSGVRSDSSENIPSAYLSAKDGKTWKYITQGKRGTQSELSPECAPFSKDEIALFKEVGLICN